MSASSNVSSARSSSRRSSSAAEPRQGRQPQQGVVTHAHDLAFTRSGRRSQTGTSHCALTRPPTWHRRAGEANRLPHPPGRQFPKYPFGSSHRVMALDLRD
jgi:hypothetical protein